MKITLLALGSRGDVQPSVALGKGLAARGHTVRVLAGTNFHPWIVKHGLETAPSSLDMQDIMRTEWGVAWAEKGTNPLLASRAVARIHEQFGWALTEDILHACEGAELILSSFTSDFQACSIAEATGALHISVPLQPSALATRHGPSSLAAVVPGKDSVLNQLFAKAMVEPTIWRWTGANVNRLRRERLRLPEHTRSTAFEALRRTPTLHGCSAHIAPRAPDWPADWQVTGYWFLDEAEPYAPPESLTRFLDAGEPPVCIGFGSMPASDPAALTRMFIDAISRSGRRAILLSGWAGLGGVPLPDTFFQIDSAPHDWLFPRVAAVVTHGGAGSVAASLRAGRPTLVVPHMSDQIYWGRRVAELQLGPSPIPRPRLRADRLAEAIALTSDPAIRRNAEAMGAKIRAEDGVTTAVDAIEGIIAARRPEGSSARGR
ncbi:glycosyltransferase [Chondromyces apiculatus]|uniref:UDP-glucose:sterol glucosyltransferase n=1 Tax=Chondromyces apiculatus DSM 436 TaxID=1192034 RepID=A0A017TG35_9BACT|nr:glycosyltransferase [Chondromyces apiculatus]EYF08199.1 UDP-glucose:sterol glucosyltransferase [Chondromyces apiculatus DSM 436]